MDMILVMTGSPVDIIHNKRKTPVFIKNEDGRTIPGEVVGDGKTFSSVAGLSA